MDYTSIINDLKKASLFDLYRLNSAIVLLLGDHVRLDSIKRALSLNSDISYFDRSTNKLTPATLLEKRRTTALVRSHHDGRKWVIPLYWINLDSVETDIYSSSNNKRGLDKNQLQIGQVVSFVDQDGVDHYGQVIRLNQKTVSIIENNQRKWRVSYCYLSNVIDSNVTYSEEPSTATILTFGNQR
jgi:hypothetical protein